MAANAIPAGAIDVNSLAGQLESFLRSCREPKLLEPGLSEIPLIAGHYQFLDGGPTLVVEAWDDKTFVSRRVLGIRARSRDRLELETLQFAGKHGRLYLFDSFRPANDGLAKKGKRLVFGSAFRAFLAREFAGWRIATLSTEAHLEHSLSPSYPRALLTRGKLAWAAIASPPNSDADRLLSFGLIWHDYLRLHQPQFALQGLALFLPEGLHRPTCLRLPYLRLRTQTFTYTPELRVDPLDPADSGNYLSLLEASTLNPGPRQQQPEALLESRISAEIQTLDANLRPTPVYGQVLSFHGVDRGIFDLLAVGYDSRLTVIEIKAEQAIHLPLQALDYWIRVRHHLERGDFARLFPGIPLSPGAPRLILATPALCFHPSNERILTYFRDDIPIERVGLAHGLDGPLRVLFRERR